MYSCILMCLLQFYAHREKMRGNGREEDLEALNSTGSCMCTHVYYFIYCSTTLLGRRCEVLDVREI